MSDPAPEATGITTTWCLPAAIKNAELPGALSVEFRVLAHAGIDGVNRANAARRGTSGAQ